MNTGSLLNRRQPVRLNWTLRRTRLFQQVWKNQHGAEVILFQVHSHVRCDDILTWLLRNQITGKKLIEFFEDHCQKSFITMFQKIIKAIDRDLALKPVLAGKHYRV